MVGRIKKIVAGIMALGIGAIGLSSKDKSVSNEEIVNQLNTDNSVERVVNVNEGQNLEFERLRKNIQSQNSKIVDSKLHIFLSKDYKVSKQESLKYEKFSHIDKNNLKNFDIKDFNPRMYDKQKEAINTFLLLNYEDIFENPDHVVKKYVNNIVADIEGLRFDKINENLGRIIYKLTKEENVNSRLIFAITYKESLFGKINTSKNSARGPLQSMPGTMIERCSEYLPKNLGQYKTEFLNWYLYRKRPNSLSKEKFNDLINEVEVQFISNLYVQMKAGLREVKSISRGYGIDISFNSGKISVDNLILILASYNKGYGSFKRNPKETLLNISETKEYVRVVLALMNKYDKFIISRSKGIII